MGHGTGSGPARARCGTPSRRLRNVVHATTLVLAVVELFAVPDALAGRGRSRLERAAAEWSNDGLRRQRVPGLDLVYVREGASLRGYGKVWIKSVEVSFRRDWEVPTRPGALLVTRDVTAIKERLERILREETARELERGGYGLAEAPGDGVLEIDVDIVDVYINALDLQGSLPVDRYTLSAGEMTLVAELRDSPTGDLIARVLDRREDRDRGFFEFTTSVENVAVARQAARQWAQILRRRLDAAKAIGAPP